MSLQILLPRKTYTGRDGCPLFSGVMLITVASDHGYSHYFAQQHTIRAMKSNQVLRLTSGDLLAGCLERHGTGTREAANSVLFNRGEPARGAYLVLSGAVELSLGAERAGRLLINRTVGP